MAPFAKRDWTFCSSTRTSSGSITADRILVDEDQTGSYTGPIKKHLAEVSTLLNSLPMESVYQDWSLVHFDGWASGHRAAEWQRTTKPNSLEPSLEGLDTLVLQRYGMNTETWVPRLLLNPAAPWVEKQHSLFVVACERKTLTVSAVSPHRRWPCMLHSHAAYTQN